MIRKLTHFAAALFLAIVLGFYGCATTSSGSGGRNPNVASGGFRSPSERPVGNESSSRMERSMVERNQSHGGGGGHQGCH